MTDLREIEGTPARAADRGSQEDLGFSMGDRPHLGNADVVRSLVSEFASAVVGVRKSYNESSITGEQSQEQIRELAKEYGGIIMGRDDRYESMPWNNPVRLGRRIKLVVPDLTAADDPGELLFLSVGTGLITAAVAHEEGRMTDEDTESQVQGMLDDAANLILGLR